MSDGYVLRFDGARWAAITSTLDGGAFPVERHWSLEADWTVTPNLLFLTTDDRVYLSTDLGSTWRTARAGLPQRAHLADLRFVLLPDGTRRVYVSTFGRSIWFADVR